MKFVTIVLHGHIENIQGLTASICSTAFALLVFAKAGYNRVVGSNHRRSSPSIATPLYALASPVRHSSAVAGTNVPPSLNIEVNVGFWSRRNAIVGLEAWRRERPQLGLSTVMAPTDPCHVVPAPKKESPSALAKDLDLPFSPANRLRNFPAKQVPRW